jgi:hypothetical protein
VSKVVKIIKSVAFDLTNLSGLKDPTGLKRHINKVGFLGF